MPVVRVNGVELAYEIAGDSGPVVVLSHGSWGDRRGWGAVVPGLTQSFRVVTWDRCGHGESGDRPGQGTREQDSDDLAGLIEALEIAPVHLVGNSFGGSISLGLVSRRPDLVRSLAVHEPPVFDVLREIESPDLAVALERIALVTEALAEGDLKGGAALFANTVVGSAGNWENYSAETQSAMMRNAPTFLDENRDPAVFSLDLNRISAFVGPALLSYGDASPVYFEQVVRRVAEALPNASVHCFAGAGHVPHRSHPAEYVAVLTGFITEHS